ncbi:alcohol dehydrogenase catalytic domain-containing protein [Arthrobacter sp. S2(2024)]|uniref:alcohol dehydrogenase catalytic domain-containing protein n=1 Tax=Arthrobacter sp. S2(2024) TaxID=3111911 RepID=UPI003FA544DB
MATSATIALHYPGATEIEIASVTLPDPTGHQVLVTIESTGVCRSQLSEMSRHTTGGPLPLGHEGVGVVTAVGPDVDTYSPGDGGGVKWCSRTRSSG